MESDGCLVAPAVFKTAVGSSNGSRCVRFAPSPPSCRGKPSPNVAPSRMSPKLTSLSSCAGCAAKLGQEALSQVLKLLPRGRRDPRLLIGADTADDAAVYRLDERQALVQTVDFFTPIVDDPFTYGQIAATNAISDVYAMGGRPLTALNIVGIPADKVTPKVMARILNGGVTKAREAGCTVVGGHSIRLPEPVYGMAVTGLVTPHQLIANTNAKAGDYLVLTKPLGTGIITTAIKRNLASASLRGKAIASMTALNRVGADLAESELVIAGTDVTGFGLLGHLANICRGSGVGAEVDASAVPVLGGEVLELIEEDCIPGGTRKNLQTAEKITEWDGVESRQKYLLADAQTSGGLLVCVAPNRLEEVLAVMQRSRTLCAAIIGRMVRSRAPAIQVSTGLGFLRQRVAISMPQLRSRRFKQNGHVKGRYIRFRVPFENVERFPRGNGELRRRYKRART